jgi:hypothetical protein
MLDFSLVSRLLLSDIGLLDRTEEDAVPLWKEVKGHDAIHCRGIRVLHHYRVDVRSD